MTSLLHCLFRHCLEHQDRDPHNNNNNNEYSDGEDEETLDEGSATESGDNHIMGTAQSTPTPRIASARRQSMRRGDPVYYVRAPGGQRPQGQGSAGDYGTTTDEQQSALGQSIELASGENNNAQPIPMWGGLFRLVRSSRNSQSSTAVAPATAVASIGDKLKDDDSYRAAPPCIKEAQSFVLCGERDQKNSYPSINLNEIVLPGSDVQRAMAKQMQLEMQYDEGDGDAHMEDECVICMDGFSPDNPRMPTLCGCGENKTYFHLPCLYQWIEQSRKCPSCRKKLVWEEF